MHTTYTAEDYRKEVISIPVGAGVIEASERMVDEAVGSLVVVDAEGLGVGILTDRDLCLRVVARTRSADSVKVEDVMTQPLVSVPPEAPIAEVVRRMRKRAVRRMPVIEEGLPVGMVSLDDILRELGSELHDLGEEVRMKSAHTQREHRYESVREGVERNVEDLRTRLEFAGWFTKKSVLKELDTIRSEVRQAIGQDEDEDDDEDSDSDSDD
jgi:signal-transduction protein with cAMP-binding, CBS, and nucleotidyltransferase domain